MKIEDLALMDNIADHLNSTRLFEISEDVMRGYEYDKLSRAEWESTNEEAMKIAKQTIESNQVPRANVKYPLIPVASMSFASRAYPTVIRDNQVVKGAYNGEDPQSVLEKLSYKIANFMSWQLLVESTDWERSLDQLLMVLPVVGTVFKKVYYNPILNTNVSELCLPNDIYINNKISSIERARRVTHKMYMYSNDIVENIRQDYYCDVLEEILGMDDSESDQDPDPRHCLLEQHTYIDLDEDGYKEPYIVTVHLNSRKILRIVPCYDVSKIQYTTEGKILSIPKVNYFIDFHFIPNPDGSYYSLGFGQLLYPLNASVNTLLNQLIDAGTFSNRQCGFLGKGFRGNPDTLRFQPGEWKKLDIPGEDINKNVFPLPVREPSNVLFTLLGMLTDAAKEIASVTEVLQGNQNAQNVPATTILALIDQGLTLYTALIKRLFGALTKEFRALYRLNSIFLDDEKTFTHRKQSDVITREEFQQSAILVYPVADPSLSSEAQRLARAQALMEMRPVASPEGQKAIDRYYLEAIQIPSTLIDQVLTDPPQAPPDPKLLEIEHKENTLTFDKIKHQSEIELKMKELELKSVDLQEKIRLQEAMIENYKSISLLNLEKLHEVSTNNALPMYLRELESLDDEESKVTDLEDLPGETHDRNTKQHINVVERPSDQVLPTAAEDSQGFLPAADAGRQDDGGSYGSADMPSPGQDAGLGGGDPGVGEPL
jgi:chaperonin GroES